MAKRKGFLTPKTFFPKTGDIFINHEDEFVPVWQCARANLFIYDKTGDKIRYALIIADIEDDEIEKPADKALSESSDMVEFLEGFSEVHRSGKRYERTENGTFVES